MTSERAHAYEEKQLENLEKLIDCCIDERIENLFIIGNLFANPKPKNKTIEFVYSEFLRLGDNNVRVIILPGAKDTPLYFSNDKLVHEIFNKLDNVELLNKEVKSSNVNEYFNCQTFNIDLKGIKLEIMVPPNPFIFPDRLIINNGFASSDSIKIFAISNLLAFKKKLEVAFSSLSEKLKDLNFDYLFLGGITRDALNQIISMKLPFEIIWCPQIHQDNFLNTDIKNGLQIADLSNNKFKLQDLPIEISNFKLTHEIINVNNVSLASINELINKTILQTQDGENGILRLTLMGKLTKEEYHTIKIFNHLENGIKRNFYFELNDEIEFEEVKYDVAGINIIDEIEVILSNKIEEISRNSDLTKEDKNQKKRYLNSVMSLIKKEWEEI